MRPNLTSSAIFRVGRVAGNPDLFGVLDTTYGGNGITTFELPNMRDRAFLGSTQVAAIPEPSTYALFVGLGAVGVAVARRRKES